MRNIKLTIEYDGKNFAGWQTQPDKESIQGEIEKAIYAVTNEKIEIVGSGRTDAGVHALGQVANFHTNSNIPQLFLHLTPNICFKSLSKHCIENII